MIQAGTALQFAEVHATITRADGRVEDLGVIDSYESDEHKLARGAKPSFLRKLAKIVGLSALLLGVAHYAPESIGPALAATVITNAGQAINTNLVSGLGGTVPRYIAWGTGAGTAAVTDTTLFTESTEETRTAGTPTRVTTTVTNDTLQVAGTITVATSGKTITNVGLFDASTSGNLFFKSDFTGLALAIGDSITFTLKIKYA